MYFRILLSVFIFFFATAAGWAQQTVDSVINKMYETIRFEKDLDPDYDDFRRLFVQNAVMVSVRDTTHSKFDVNEFVDIMERQRSEGTLFSFHEYEIHRIEEQYGHIAHVFSTYEIKLRTPDGERFPRGINSIQLLRSGENWKIVSLIWFEETDEFPLTGHYLPDSK